jgi:hypothetical protein
MGGAAKLRENPVPEIEEVCYDDPVESRFSPEQIWNPGLELMFFVCKDVFFWRIFDPNAMMIMMIFSGINGIQKKLRFATSGVMKSSMTGQL